MNKKEIERKIYKEGKETPIPGTLKPDAINQKLKRRRKITRLRRSSIAVAACLLISVTGILLTNDRVGLNNDGELTYDNLFSLIQEAKHREQKANSYSTGGMPWSPNSGTMADGEGDLAAPESAPGSENTLKDFSTTNIQVEGVDEGDIMKTDGNYVYAFSNTGRDIKIIKIDKGNLTLTASISLPDGGYTFQEMYLTDNRLIVLTGAGIAIPYDYMDPAPQMEDDEIMPYTQTQSETVVLTYDVRDKENPELLGKVSQSGTYQSSRLQGSFLYVFSAFSAGYVEDMNQKDLYVPKVNGDLLEPKDICIPEKPTSTEYLVMTGIDIWKPDQVKDKKGALAFTDTFYVSQDNIYGAAEKGKNTEIIKFSYKKGKFSYKATGIVKGYLESSFSLDEYKGNLRLVTTVEKYWGTMYNNVYVLDKNMNQIGSITGLAEDERIYSARFMEETGYFVTYRETDPLFSVDFSKPNNPKIIGSLKIPGFSEYLHFYSKDRLLGIGMEVTDHGQWLKLSMFDISDPTNVKEIHKHIIEDAYDSEALRNHRAVMIDVDKNIFGFAVYNGYESSYRIYSFKNDGFQEDARIPILEPSPPGYEGVTINLGIRGLFSDNYFYLVEPDLIRSFDMNHFREIKKLNLY